MATNLILRIPKHTLIDRAMGQVRITEIGATDTDGIAHTFGRRIYIIIAVQTILNLLAIALVGLSAGGFITGNVEVGVWALGPALAGIIGLIGFQWRIIDHSIRRKSA
ncbi:MAG: hypothetical protein IIA92_13710 [Chloroflexi bacterium]|nr:hypothetical protein [Chloroflexota bacterium]